MDEKDRTVWVGNLSEKVTESLLYELFLQAGPLEKVKLALDKDGRTRRYAFVTFKHECSVPYTIELMNGIELFGNNLRLQTRTGSSSSATYDGGSAAQSAPYNSQMSGGNSNDKRPPVNQQSPHNLQRSSTWHGNTQQSGRSPDINFRNLPNMQPQPMVAAVSFQQRRERVLQQHNLQVEIHRQQVIQRIATQPIPHSNPYGRSSRPWQQAPYRRY
ncbi:RNA-binding protein 7-like [Ylistrum balloti]|uniref:RNA-binding protein 7-like n=1 Tax=Ylistrum balloti TaxID=509963 RepID=UPI002905E78F|nr:RNA-binding protein 7-like [Ylistrum balloti]